MSEDEGVDDADDSPEVYDIPELLEELHFNWRDLLPVFQRAHSLSKSLAAMSEALPHYLDVKLLDAEIIQHIAQTRADLAILVDGLAIASHRNLNMDVAFGSLSKALVLERALDRVSMKYGYGTG